MVNCFICESPFEEGVGVCCSRKCHNVRINSQRDYSNTQLTFRKIKRIEKYNQSPKLCLNCNSAFPYEKRSLKFCNSSCSCTYNNKRRDHTVHMRQSASLCVTLAAQNKIIGPKYPFTKVTFGKCNTCSKIYRKKTGKLYCSEVCKIHTGIRTYRRACKFNITKSQYPNLFNKDLLNKHGWYRASNHLNGYNPDGATWDHLFRVEEGFKLGVDPTIMRHPANAEMISWRENFRRKTSSITYQELLERIAKWPEGNGGPAR